MQYPIGRVADEAALITRRENQLLVSLAVVVQSATGTTGMTAGKEASQNFKSLVEGLNGDD